MMLFLACYSYNCLFDFDWLVVYYKHSAIGAADWMMYPDYKGKHTEKEQQSARFTTISLFIQI